MPGQGKLEGSKKTLFLKRARQLSKKQPLVSAHQAGGRACPFPRWNGANGRPQCLYGRREAEDYRDEPWTQWCFRAESSRTSQAHSIPSPTVTAGTQFSPFKHIICARMAVKHHTPRSFTHLVPLYCCVCLLSFYYWAIKGFGSRTISQHMVSWSATWQLKDNRFLAHLEMDLFFFFLYQRVIQEISLHWKSIVCSGAWYNHCHHLHYWFTQWGAVCSAIARYEWESWLRFLQVGERVIALISVNTVGSKVARCHAGDSHLLPSLLMTER